MAMASVYSEPFIMADGEMVVDWREKCHELEQVIKTLSSHCVKVVEKYEELMNNYKKNEVQYDHLVTVLRDRGEQIKKAKGVLEPVAREYKLLREKYEIAVRCQYEAENYASKMNKAYKRQSQMLENRFTGVKAVEISTVEEESEDQLQDEYIKKLQNQIEELENEKIPLSIQVKELNENYAIEKEKNEQLKKEIEYYKLERQYNKTRMEKQDRSLKLLAETSEAALQEYEKLQRNFEHEVMGRMAIEKVASNYKAEKTAAQRQSQLLMKNIDGNTKLMEALMQVEDLTTQIENQKSDYEQKIKHLEEDIATCKADSFVSTLEAEKAELECEKLNLQERLEIAEQSSNDLRKQYDSLIAKYNDLEKRYMDSSRTPLPPPPPPPPPPVPKLGFLPKFGKKKKKEIQKKLATGGAAVSDGYTKAVDEMMNRIKNGNIALRPVLKSRTEDLSEFPRKMSLPGRSVPDDEGSNAMEELQGILSKMKKARSTDDLSAFDDDPSLDENSEFAQVFKKLKSKEKVNRPRPAPRKLSTISDKPEDEEN